MIRYLLASIVVPILFFWGTTLYFLSKLLRALSYLCLVKFNSARGEMKDFWKIKHIDL